MPQRDLRKRKEYSREYHQKHKEHKRAYRTEKRHKDKIDVFSHYSNGQIECACCGERMIKFLTIDHIDGGGGKHRRELFGTTRGSGSPYYRWLKKNKFPPGLQVQCWNCNCGRAQNGGICPHKQF